MSTSTIGPPPGSAGFDWDELPEKVKQWIMENPGQAGVYIVGGMVIFIPSLISGPLLPILGFTSLGPQAGSIAAAIQATMGSVSAGSVFACLQSAGMAGYGAAVVNAGVSMAGGVAMAANMASNFFRRMESLSAAQRAAT